MRSWLWWYFMGIGIVLSVLVWNAPNIGWASTAWIASLLSFGFALYVNNSTETASG